MLQYDQIDASFLPDPAASIAMNARHRSLISTQELGIDFTVTAFSREAINEKRREIELLITGYNLGIDYIKMHRKKEWKTGIDRDRRSGKPDRPHCTPCLQKSGAPLSRCPG